MYIGVFLIQRASFIHLVCRCAFLSTTFALSQSTTWFSSTAGSVITDFWVTLLSLALEARGLCTSCERVTKVWLSCHMWKDWARPLQEFWKLMASPQLTVLTERYGTLWFIRRTKSRMKRRPNWSIVSLARTAPAHMLERQAGSSVWGSRNTRKKWTLSQLADFQVMCSIKTWSFQRYVMDIETLSLGNIFSVV